MRQTGILYPESLTVRLRTDQRARIAPADRLGRAH